MREVKLTWIYTWNLFLSLWGPFVLHSRRLLSLNASYQANEDENVLMTVRNTVMKLGVIFFSGIFNDDAKTMTSAAYDCVFRD